MFFAIIIIQYKSNIQWREYNRKKMYQPTQLKEDKPES